MPHHPNYVQDFSLPSDVFFFFEIGILIELRLFSFPPFFFSAPLSFPRHLFVPPIFLSHRPLFRLSSYNPDF